MGYQELNAKMIDSWCGLDNGLSYIFDETGTTVKYKLTFNPLKDPDVYEDSIRNNWGIACSHTLEEQIGGQLEAGFILTDLYEDTDGEGVLHEHNVPTYIATRAVCRGGDFEELGCNPYVESEKVEYERKSGTTMYKI